MSILDAKKEAAHAGRPPGGAPPLAPGPGLRPVMEAAFLVQGVNVQSSTGKNEQDQYQYQGLAHTRQGKLC